MFVLYWRPLLAELPLAFSQNGGRIETPCRRRLKTGIEMVKLETAYLKSAHTHFGKSYFYS
jgi:hypothetical protein